MTRKEKLLQRIKNNPKHASFEDLDKLLLCHGFTRRPQRAGSSHFYYTHGAHIVSVPYQRPHVGQVYVRKVLQILELVAEESGGA